MVGDRDRIAAELGRYDEFPSIRNIGGQGVFDKLQASAKPESVEAQGPSRALLLINACSAPTSDLLQVAIRRSSALCGSFSFFSPL